MTDSQVIDIAMQWMKDQYEQWFEHSRQLLKFPREIVSFVASCNFSIEQLCYIEEQIEKLRIGKQNDDYDRNLNEIEDQYVPEVEHYNE